MTFGTEWGYGATAEESKLLFERFLAMGGNFFDTANRYTDGSRGLRRCRAARQRKEGKRGSKAS